MGLSCGHTVCAGCDAAIRRPDKKECPVCYAELKGDGLKNPVLGAFCDESLPESSPATDSDARDGVIPFALCCFCRICRFYQGFAINR